MKVDEKTAVTVFDRMVALYPRSFKDRFGEPMRQTFRDVCRDNRAADGKLAMGFVVTAFGGTLSGVIAENLLEFIKLIMKNAIYRIVLSATIGIIATVPFVIIEYVYSGGFPLGVPFAIFNILWLEASLFTYLAISLFRTPRAGSVSRWILPFVLKSAALIVVMSSWAFIVNDQLPCFLGGRGC